MGSLRVRHDFTFTFHFHALEKEMATHSSVLAWRIPGMVEPGGLPVYGFAQSRTRLKWLSSSSSSSVLLPWSPFVKLSCAYDYLYVVFKRLFKEQFRFVTKSKGRFRDFTCAPCSHTESLLINNLSHQNGTFFFFNQKSIIYFGVQNSWYCVFCWLR